VVIARALIERGWWSNDDFVIFILSSLFVYGVILVRYTAVAPPEQGKHDWPFLGTFLLSTVVNLTLLILNFTTPPPPRNKYDYIHINIASIRTFLFLLLAIISEVLRTRPISLPDSEATAQPLKSNGAAHYGTFDAGPAHPHSGRGGFGSNPPPQGGWITYIRSFKVFFPHLWPSTDRYLQGVMLFCFVLLMIGRVVNVLIPRQLGIVTDELTGEGGSPRIFRYIPF
jgi:hypothetical protein